MGEAQQRALDQEFDAGRAAVLYEIVCSVCGENHDRDESAACDGCEAITFVEWTHRVRERVKAAERERDEWKRDADLSKWPKEAAQEFFSLRARVAELEEERDNAIAAFNEQCARLDAIEEIVSGVPVAGEEK
jgi:hypothetical protein